MIDNIKYNAPITKKEIYNGVMEYSVEEPYYFESNGISYGQHVFGTILLDNHYVVKKKDETNSKKNSI